MQYPSTGFCTLTKTMMKARDSEGQHHARVDMTQHRLCSTETAHAHGPCRGRHHERRRIWLQKCPAKGFTVILLRDCDAFNSCKRGSVPTRNQRHKKTSYGLPKQLVLAKFLNRRQPLGAVMRQSSRTHLGSSSKACGYMQQVITRFMGFSVLCKNKLFALIDSHTCPASPAGHLH